MTTDAELLAAYARTNSGDAFAELVKRHVNLVYSAALRQVNGDAHLAQDVAQTVFADLARKAGSLSRRESLTGWLYTSAHFAAAKSVRAETRRRDREVKFMREPTNESAPEADWEQIRPALDAAMHELKEADREAILLRYFENRPFAEVGAKLGLNENAARMRVERALDKLRGAFARRGIATTVPLAAAISAHAVQLAPAGLAAALVTTSMVPAGAGIFTLLKIMTATQIKIGVGVLVVAGTVAVMVHQQQTQNKLRVENDLLAQQIAKLKTENESLSKHATVAQRTPRLPAPAMQIAVHTNELTAREMQFTNVYVRFKDAPPKLTAGQIEAYLKANRTNAASLLAAYRTGADPALLKAAMEKYPNDPRVAFEAILNKDLPPEQQRQWLDLLEKSDPDNSLANYLSAFNYFNSGQIDQGIQEMTAAAGKGFQSYTLARAQDDEEAYLSAGYSAAEAERVSDGWLEVSDLHQVKLLGVDLVDLAKAYNQAGDQASAQAAFQMAMNMGQRYADQSTDPMLLSQLVGMAIQKIALSAMDPNSIYGQNGQTVQDQINQISQTRAAINQLVEQTEPFLSTMSDQDILNYENRRRMFGELSAFQWVANKFGQK